MSIGIYFENQYSKFFLITLIRLDPGSGSVVSIGVGSGSVEKSDGSSALVIRKCILHANLCPTE